MGDYDAFSDIPDRRLVDVECWGCGEQFLVPDFKIYRNISYCRYWSDWMVGGDMEPWDAGLTRRKAPHALATCRMGRRNAQRPSAADMSSPAQEKERGVCKKPKTVKGRSH